MMKKALILIAFVSICWNTIYAQSECEKMPLKEALAQWRGDHGSRFFFKDEWVENDSICLQGNTKPSLDQITEKLNSKGLHIAIIDSVNYVVLLQPIRHELPLFDKSAVVDNMYGNPLTERDDLKDEDVLQSNNFTIGKAGLNNNGNPVRIRGHISDMGSGEPLIGATVYVQETENGTITDVKGDVSLTLNPGDYNVMINTLGYEERLIKLKVHSNGEFRIQLKEQVITLDELTVTAESSTHLYAMSTGMQQLSMKTIKQIPVLMGEKDILKISQMLPGVVSVGEGTGAINVRGGNSDQNMFYINSVPIYNTSHLMGFFSAFNSDIISDFTLYKGHVPARYGGRLSSIFNITARHGNSNNFSMHGGISPISAFVTAEGPLKKNKSSMFISGRSSYSDWILNRIDNPEVNNSRANFYDISSLIKHEVNEKNLMSVFFYASHDNFKHNGIMEYQYQNIGGSANWNIFHSSSLKTSINYSFARYSSTTADLTHTADAYELQYNIGHQELQAHVDWNLGSKHQIQIGGSSLYHPLNRGKVSPYDENSSRTPFSLGEEKGWINSFHIEDQYEIAHWATAYLGLRYSFYSSYGPKEALVPDETGIFSPSSIRDTISYGNGEKIASYSYPEIRASVNFRVGPSTSVKASYNQMNQYIFQLNSNVSAAPNDQWKLADGNIKPARGEQFSSGIYHTFENIGLEVSADVFYKRAKNILAYKDGANFTDSKFVELSVLPGKQESYGSEFLVKKKSGRIQGWASYTYSRAFIIVESDDKQEEINGGDPYPANFDVPHVANLVMNYHLNRRYVLSANFVYKTGRPVTVPESIFYVDGVPYVNYSEKNSERIPEYIRADLSLTIEGNLKRKKAAHSSWVFSVYNVMGRKNPYSVYFKTEDGNVRGYKYSVIGVPIFTATWTFKFGNYASY